MVESHNHGLNYKHHTPVVKSNIPVCQKNCGIDYGKCLILQGDMQLCLKQEAACALDCLKGLTVEDHKHGPNHKHHAPVVKSDIGKCQKNCGIDYGKCLIQTFDMPTCIKNEAACALDCLKGVQFVAKWEKPVVPHVKGSEQGKCQKNCAIDMGKCVILTGNPLQCMREEAACSLECLKSLSVKSGYKLKAGDGVCQKNCAIDSAKCLITTFDMETCIKQEAVCALDCLKSVHSTHDPRSPPDRSAKCSVC